MIRGNRAAQGILLALIAFSVWACGDALVKYLGQRLPLTTIIFFSELVCVVEVGVLGLTGRCGGFDFHWRGRTSLLYGVRGLFVLVQFLSGMYAFIHTDLPKAYALMFCAPLVTALLARLFLREAVGLWKWLAIALGFAGVLVVLRPGVIAFDAASGAALISTVCFGFSNVIARRQGRQGEDTVITAALVTEVIVFIGTAILFVRHPTLPSPSDGVWLLLSGTLSTTGLLCLWFAFARAPAPIVAPFHYVQMLWALFFSYAVFGTVPDRIVGLGAAIVIAAGLWLIWLGARPTGDIIPEATSPPAEAPGAH